MSRHLETFFFIVFIFHPYFVSIGHRSHTHAQAFWFVLYFLPFYTLSCKVDQCWFDCLHMLCFVVKVVTVMQHFWTHFGDTAIAGDSCIAKFVIIKQQQIVLISCIEFVSDLFSGVCIPVTLCVMCAKRLCRCNSKAISVAFYVKQTVLHHVKYLLWQPLYSILFHTLSLPFSVVSLGQWVNRVVAPVKVC